MDISFPIEYEPVQLFSCFLFHQSSRYQDNFWTATRIWNLSMKIVGYKQFKFHNFIIDVLPLIQELKLVTFMDEK